MAKVYIVAELVVNDPALFGQYVEAALPTIAQYGGRVLAATDQVQPAEGDWKPERITILEFDSAEQMQRWYESSEYAEPMKMRHKAAQTKAVLVPGL